MKRRSLLLGAMGLGGMGGAQPLAAVMAGASCLAVECDETRADFRLRTRYLDEKTHSLDEALEMINVQYQQGRRSLVATPVLYCLACLQFQEAAVVGTSQGISDGHITQAPGLLRNRK